MIIRSIVLLSVLCLLTPLAAGTDSPTLKTDEQKTLYTIGRILAQRLGGFELTEQDVELILVGAREEILGVEPRVSREVYEPMMNELLRARMAAKAEREEQEGRAFLEQMAREPGGVKLESGLIFFELKAGTGAAPGADATVRLHHKGTLADGTVFTDSTTGEGATFPLSGVVPCFSEGILRMKVGGKSKIVCPPDIAYGDQGRPPLILPGATLVFEIELMEILAAPKAARP